MLKAKYLGFAAIVFLILLGANTAYSANISNASNSKNASFEILEKGANVSVQLFSNISQRILDKKIVQQISYFSDYAAQFIASRLNLTPAEAKLLEYYIFILIIVLLAEYIARFGKFVLLIFGLLVGGLIIYNDPQNMIWGLIILGISVLYWYRR